MITRRNLTTDTHCTLLLGIATRGNRCAVSGSIRTVTGDIETEVIALAGDGLWPTLCAALVDVRLCKVKYLVMLTTSAELIRFLTPPIFMAPTTKTTVQPLNKRVWDGKRWVADKPSIVPTGGDESKWELLRQLFIYDAWKVFKVDSLPGAKKLLEKGKSNE